MLEWAHDGELTRTPRFLTHAQAAVIVPRLVGAIDAAWVALRRLVVDRGFWIQELFLSLSDEEKQAVFDAAWHRATNQTETALPAYQDMAWLRDHYRRANPAETAIQGWTIDQPRSDYHDKWAPMLTYSHTQGETLESRFHLLAPQILRDHLIVPQFFFNFLHARAHANPETFCRYDAARCNVGKATRLLQNDFLLGHSLVAPYGPVQGNVPAAPRLATFGNDPDAPAFQIGLDQIRNGEALVVGEGLSLLRAQVLIYQFLLASCQTLIANHGPRWNEMLGRINFPSREAQGLAAQTRVVQSTRDDAASQLILSNYQNPEVPNFAAIQDLINHRHRTALDHYRDMRRHPSYFWRMVNREEKHFFGLIHDASGRTLCEQVVDSPTSGAQHSFPQSVRAWLIKQAVLRAVSMSVYWTYVKRSVDELVELQAADPDEDALLDAYDRCYVVVRQAIEETRSHFVLQKMTASPHLRRYFVRRTPTAGFPGQSLDDLLDQTTIVPKPDASIWEPVEFATNNDAIPDLVRLARLLSDGVATDHAGAQNLVDYLSPYLNPDWVVETGLRCWDPEILSDYAAELTSEFCTLGSILGDLESLRETSLRHRFVSDPALVQLRDSGLHQSMQSLKKFLAVTNDEAQNFFAVQRVPEPAGDAAAEADLLLPLEVDASRENHQQHLDLERSLQALWKTLDRRIRAAMAATGPGLLDGGVMEVDADSPAPPPERRGAQDGSDDDVRTAYQALQRGLDNEILQKDLWTKPSWSRFYQHLYDEQVLQRDGQAPARRILRTAVVLSDASFNVMRIILCLTPGLKRGADSITFAQFVTLAHELGFDAVRRAARTGGSRRPFAPNATCPFPRAHRFTVDAPHGPAYWEMYQYKHWRRELFEPMGINSTMVVSQAEAQALGWLPAVPAPAP